VCVDVSLDDKHFSIIDIYLAIGMANIALTELPISFQSLIR